MTLIHNYLYKEIILLTAAIIGVLTFLLVALELFKVIQMIMYTDLPFWIVAKFILLLIPFVLTLTIPTGLLAAVMIVFGRMSSDRELLALKASGIGLAPIVAPVIVVAVIFMILNFWLVASVTPECRKEYNGMKHEIATNNPLALFNPEVVVDKIPGWRIYCSKKDGSTLKDVILWQLDDANHVKTSMRADQAKIDLDLEHQQLDMILINERSEQYGSGGDATKVQIGGRGAQMVVSFSLNSFYEKLQRKLAWMTLPPAPESLIPFRSVRSSEVGPPSTASGPRSFERRCVETGKTLVVSWPGGSE